MIKLDEIDNQILEMLQADAKTNIKTIADKLRLTKSPVYDRINKLEKEGVIEKYVAVLNTKYIKRSMFVFCTVLLENQKLTEIDKFSRAVEKIPEVIECYLMGGTNDFLLKVVVQDLQAYHEFSSGKLAALPNVSQIKSTFVLNQVKKSTVVPVG